MRQVKGHALAALIAKTIKGADEVYVFGQLNFIVSEAGHIREVLLITGGRLVRGKLPKAKRKRGQPCSVSTIPSI